MAFEAIYIQIEHLNFDLKLTYKTVSHVINPRTQETEEDCFRFEATHKETTHKK